MDVVRVLKENSITPRKEYDQFFLTDEKVLEKEVKLAKLSAKDTVLEIGCGPGNLTEKIAKKAKVVAIEKDYAFRNVLKSVQNTNVLFGDAVEILESLRKYREAKGGGAQFNKVVSNIPYSVSQDILVELLKHTWSIAVLIVQKEFASKLKEKEKIAVAANDCCDITIGDAVSAEKFFPKAVDSTMIVLEQKKLLDEGFWNFLADVYKDRNKDVGNVMKGKNYPVAFAKKKVHQLTNAEIKKIYEMQKEVK